MTVRRATLDDYSAVMKMYDSFIGPNRFTKPEDDSFAQVIDSPNNAVFVAEEDGQLVGFATASVRLVVRYPKPIIELDELFVDDTIRSHGTGTALLEAIEGFGRQNNCHRMYIVSGYEHEAAHAFYEHRGYKKNGYHFLKNL